MKTGGAHLSDLELVMLADGEVAGRRAGRMRGHLEGCWHCRGRMAGLEGAAVAFTRAYEEGEELPSSEGPRALLRARMAEMAAEHGDRGWRRLIPLRVGAQAGAVCVMVLAVTLMGRSALRRADAGGTRVTAEAGVKPDRRLTPGATRRATLDDLCAAEHEEVVGQVTASLRQEVLKEYGIVGARGREYEIDYLIAPGLGGAEDLQNLWPQPYAAKAWNAYAKDALEERLHRLVCARKMDLGAAQRAIAEDWIAAYKEYVGEDGTSVADLEDRSGP